MARGFATLAAENDAREAGQPTRGRYFEERRERSMRWARLAATEIVKTAAELEAEGYSSADIAAATERTCPLLVIQAQSGIYTGGRSDWYGGAVRKWLKR